MNRRAIGAIVLGVVVGGCAFLQTEKTSLESCGVAAVEKVLPLLEQPIVPLTLLESLGADAECVAAAVVAYEESASVPDAGVVDAGTETEQLVASGGLGNPAQPGALEATMNYRATAYRNAKAFLAHQKAAASVKAAPYTCVLVGADGGVK